MSKKVMIGIEGVARKVKKGYIGINGVAHKIKKAYIGIGGVARPFWSTAEKWGLYGSLPTRTGSIVTLNAGSNKAYALFCGLANEPESYGAYDRTLTLAHPSAAPATTTWDGACAVVADMILFAAYGATTGYDTELTLHALGNCTIDRYGGGATSDHHAIFAGGGTSGSAANNRVNAYDKDFSRIDTTLSQARTCLANSGTQVGPYGIIVGGDIPNSQRSNVVDAFDAELTRQTVYISGGRRWMLALSDGNRALVAGGETNGSVLHPEVYTVDADLVCGSAESMFLSRAWCSGGCREGLYLIAGCDATTEMYDANLVHTYGPALPNGMTSPEAAACIDDFLIICDNSNPIKTCAYVLE